jgi:D-alanyl-D-alanine carboxypeptidase/D-alanyl-D-alanine-endopeptidase (penicillin-binding protein 4)
VGAEANLDDDNGKSARKYYDELFDKYEIECEKCRLNDGSGLSRRNLVTPESIIKVLQQSYKSSFRNEFRRSFSLAGNDGTLKKRLRNSTGNGNITAKTGTLRNVSALAGYIDTIEGDTIAFAFIFNGPNVGIYKDLENKLAQLLSDFTYRFSVTDSYE